MTSEAQIAALEAENAALRARVSELPALHEPVAALRARVQELEAQRAKGSRNSGSPPTNDGVRRTRSEDAPDPRARRQSPAPAHLWQPATCVQTRCPTRKGIALCAVLTATTHRAVRRFLGFRDLLATAPCACDP